MGVVQAVAFEFAVMSLAGESYQRLHDTQDRNCPSLEFVQACSGCWERAI